MMTTEDLAGAESDWWQNILEDRAADGFQDASRGVYHVPYPDSNDPQDEDENAAYDGGFKRGRNELGDSFKLA